MSRSDPAPPIARVFSRYAIRPDFAPCHSYGSGTYVSNIRGVSRSLVVTGALGVQHLGVEWVLLFVLWAPVLGALLLRAAIECPARRARTVDGYVRAAIFLHALALAPMFVSWGVALLVLAGFDAALLLMVWSARRDERTLTQILKLVADPTTTRAGAQQAEDWLEHLARRTGADGLSTDHALACAQALDAAGHGQKADEVLERLPRRSMSSRDRARIDLELAFHALTRNALTRARTFVHRALDHSARSADEATAHLLDALIDAVTGHPQRALLSISRISGAIVTAQQRALVALAQSHALSARGEIAAARRALRHLDASARHDAERIARGCPGPASPLFHSCEDAPYR